MSNRMLRPLLSAALVVALGGLAACSAGATNTSAGLSARSDSGSGSESGSGGATAGGIADGLVPGSKPDQPARTTVRTQAVIRTGDLAVTGKDVGHLRAEVMDLLRSVGGTLEKEDTSNDRHGRIAESTLVLRVPVASFDATKESLEKLGKLTYSHESATDVTTQVIDVDERVQTLQNSLDRLQRFQRSATDVADLLRYEDQITRRQSELRSTRAQQSYLADQTSLSTIVVHLSTPDNPVPEPGALDDAGFLSGLRGGWHAMQAVVVVAATVAGALLPFLVALALVAFPGWLLVRALVRRRRTTAAAGPPASAES
jgi:hypothetical protein